MLWEMSTNDWMVSAAFFCCITYLTGYLADRILLSAGFGTIGNWLLLLAGCYAGMFGVNTYGFELDWYPYITVGAIVLASTGILMSLCVVKRVFYL